MRKFIPLPDQQYLKQIFNYDPATGIVTWKHNGYEVGYIRYVNGKLVGMQIKLGGKNYFLSRIIWKWVTGNDPTCLIDHQDLNPTNNSWINLREANESENRANSFKRVTFNKRSTVCKLKGVSIQKGRYQASISKDNKQYHLGFFDTEQEAHDAYVDAAKQIHGAFHRPK